MSRGVWYRWQATEDATATDPDYQSLAREWHSDVTAQDIRMLGLAADRHRPPQHAAIRTDRPQVWSEKIERARRDIAAWNHEWRVIELAKQLTEAHVRAAAKRVQEWQQQNWL